MIPFCLEITADTVLNATLNTVMNAAFGDSLPLWSNGGKFVENGHLLSSSFHFGEI